MNLNSFEPVSIDWISGILLTCLNLGSLPKRSTPVPSWQRTPGFLTSTAVVPPRVNPTTHRPRMVHWSVVGVSNVTSRNPVAASVRSTVSNRSQMIPSMPMVPRLSVSFRTVERAPPLPPPNPTSKPTVSVVASGRRKPKSRKPKPATQPEVSGAERCTEQNCRLPYCHCGSAQIPGRLKAKEIPQLVMITFDDSINELNWELYQEIFSDRRNPNGCPILGTFYVSHEWTDYSQVQNLYAAGHEMASHSIT